MAPRRSSCGPTRRLTPIEGVIIGSALSSANQRSVVGLSAWYFWTGSVRVWNQPLQPSPRVGAWVWRRWATCRPRARRRTTTLRPKWRCGALAPRPRRSWPRPASPASTSWPPPIRAASSPDRCQEGLTGDSPMSRCSAPGCGRRWGLSVASGGRRPRCRSDARRFRSRVGGSGRDARTWLTLIRVVVADRVSRCRKRSTTTSPSRPVGSVRRSDDTTQRAYGEAKLRPSTPDTDPTESFLDVVTSGVRS
jgi:hypothetical protein